MSCETPAALRGSQVLQPTTTTPTTTPTTTTATTTTDNNNKQPQQHTQQHKNGLAKVGHNPLNQWNQLWPVRERTPRGVAGCAEKNGSTKLPTSPTRFHVNNQPQKKIQHFVASASGMNHPEILVTEVNHFPNALPRRM